MAPFSTSSKAFLLFACIMLLPVNVISSADANKGRTAVIAAEQWMAMIDAGRYAESWEEAASIFRGRVQKQKWLQMTRLVREPLGKIISRKITSEKFEFRQIDGVRREFLVVRFETSFENMNYTVETITSLLDKDGRWRVSGYLINSRFDYVQRLMPLLLLFVIVIAWLLELKPKFRFFGKNLG